MSAAEFREDCRNPGRYVEATFDDLDPDVADQCLAWVRRLTDRYESHELRVQGPNLVFYGLNGHGKTHSAWAVAHLLRHTGYPSAVFGYIRDIPTHCISASSFVRAVQSDPTNFDILADVAVLILDDLSAARSTDFAIEQLHAMIDLRYTYQRPMVFTTNHTRQSTADTLGESIASRVFDESVLVKISGVNRRVEAAKV